MNDNNKKDIFNKYLEIKMDLINNLKDVSNRSHHYTHKYRGNRITDLNVALGEGKSNSKTIQIFIRNNGFWIKDIISYNSKGVINSNVKSNFILNV